MHWQNSDEYSMLRPEERCLCVSGGLLNVPGSSQGQKHEASEAANGARLQELLDATPDGILEVDRQGRIILLNASAAKIFGYSREELVGQNVEILIDPEARGRHREHRAEYWAAPKTRPMGLGLFPHGRRQNGTLFPVEISLSPSGPGDARRVIAVVRDLTERVREEEQIRDAAASFDLRNREVERANRLQSDFLSSMRHELCTPLHTIIGFTELLIEGLEGPVNEKQGRFLQHVRRDSMHLLGLINDVLDLSALEAGKVALHKQSFDAGVAVQEACAEFEKTAAARSIPIKNDLPPGLAIVADRGRFQEMIHHLLGNALKFTPEGGEIVIGAALEDGTARFWVRDTGIGTMIAQQEAILEQSQQAGMTQNEIRDGARLDLAITKRLVELHGGKMWEETEPAGGRRFCFTLPLPDCWEEEEPLVLVIENDPSGQELLLNYLLAEHYQAETVNSVEAGLRRAGARRPDLITLDLMLPGIRGLAALEQLKKTPRTRNIPVIVISVLDFDERILNAGAAAYLQKPVDKDTLLAELRRLLPGSRREGQTDVSCKE